MTQETTQTPIEILWCSKFTCAHDLTEDRLLLHCQAKDTEITKSFYLTARFTRELVAHLFAHPNLPDLNDQWLNRPLKKRVNESPVVPKQRASSAHRLESGAQDVGPDSHMFPLVNTCDITVTGPQSIQLVFKSLQFDRSMGVGFQLNEESLLGVFGILYQQVLTAGWGLGGWPEHGAWSHTNLAQTQAVMH